MPILAAFMVPHPPMIVPAVGQGSEAQIVETTRAYERVADEVTALAPDTIIITSPHSVMYADYFHISPGGAATGSFRRFRAPEVRFSEAYDTASWRTKQSSPRERCGSGIRSSTTAQWCRCGSSGKNTPGGSSCGSACPGFR